MSYVETQAPPPQGIDPSAIYMQTGDGVIDPSTASIFAGVSKYGMHQKVELLEAATCGCCEQQNSYKIYDQNGQKILKIKEDSSCLCRVCCRPYHQLQLEVKNEISDDHEQVLLLDRPFRCGSCCPVWGPCCQQQLDVYVREKGEGGEDDPNLLGSVTQPLCGGFCTPTVELGDVGSCVGTPLGDVCPRNNACAHNNAHALLRGLQADVGKAAGRPGAVKEKKQEEPFATITGPTCCFGGLTEMCCDQTFSITHSAGD
eukprot:gene24823-30243_t